MMKEFIEESGLNKPFLIVTVGLPGSGKSTYYNTPIIKNYYTLVSSDAIRQEVFGDINDQTHNNEVFEIMLKRTADALNEGKSVYYDATNLSSRRRTNLLKTLKQKVKVEFGTNALIFAPDFAICCERNSKRDRVVPQHAMKRMLRSFEPPYYNEGWDSIQKQDYSNTPGYLRVKLENLIGVPHDNPHHILTIGAHMEFTNLLFRSKYTNFLNEKKLISDTRKIISFSDYEVLNNATRYHDIGKDSCKTFTDGKGNPTRIAHYYNHANVGAYIYISNTANDDEELLTANLIADHMKFFNGEKAVEMLKEKYGNKFWMLEELHEFDTSAH